MMDNKFTPGPWLQDSGCDAGWLRDGNKKALAYICVCIDCTNNRPLHERKANARLMAAAPGLLDALKRMEHMHQLMMEKIDHGKSWYDAECMREMNEAPLQAAITIAAAEGEDKAKGERHAAQTT